MTRGGGLDNVRAVKGSDITNAVLHTWDRHKDRRRERLRSEEAFLASCHFITPTTAPSILKLQRKAKLDRNSYMKIQQKLFLRWEHRSPNEIFPIHHFSLGVIWSDITHDTTHIWYDLILHINQLNSCNSKHAMLFNATHKIWPIQMLHSVDTSHSHPPNSTESTEYLMQQMQPRIRQCPCLFLYSACSLSWQSISRC